MNGKTLALGALAATLLLLSGCMSDSRVAAHPARPTAVVAAPPPPQPVVVAAEPVYVPEPYDAYISVALDSDIVFTGGNTYYWYVGHDGRRHRRLYAHGDRRGELLHRRSQLRLVMAHHEGHLPMQKAHVTPPRTRHAAPVRQAKVHQAHQLHSSPARSRSQQARQSPQHHHQVPGKPTPAPNSTAAANQRPQSHT
ncbi:MAG: hypothetical protein EPN70_10790 [Paraburkholderia sp.]|uniref:hypothetical protein n=1 Tax=Paraburkholderia sp. TaxID=1926495 RepID=UPI00120E2A27|nr:hypothetical protein [Paraburkholderia sp.]TAM04734.1 MAG: hypothetical protein EPN70_10790 [Paraburkholderia sp.]TAM30020.1 MAG: hypothetical protein EPN59_10425 [Paraburkholderia sp.]